ncbi:MAG: ferritin family protein [Candidatus Zixiibacteriota bacterium]
MSTKDEQINIVDTLAKHEEAINRLYRTYADKFPDHQEFWMNLATDESKHSEWLRKLLDKAKEGTVFIDEKRFKVQAIQTSLDFILRQIADAENDKIEFKNALSVALDIERAMIEKKYFEVFEGDSVELKHVLLALAESTKEHIHRVERAWTELKQQ